MHPIPFESSGRDDRAILPRAFVGTQAAYEHICAYGRAMGWAERPFDFVVEQWLASRPERTTRHLLSLPTR